MNWFGSLVELTRMSSRISSINWQSIVSSFWMASIGNSPVEMLKVEERFKLEFFVNLKVYYNTCKKISFMVY